MNKKIFLKLKNTKGLFDSAYNFGEEEDTAFLSVKNNARAVKKVQKNFYGEKIIVEKKSVNEKIFEGRLICYKKYDYKAFLPVINNICKQAVKKFNMAVPVGEIYIVANPVVACLIAERLCSLSKIFTVISKEECRGALFDELYFKYGVLIRHLPDFNNNITKDALIIRCNAEKNFHSFGLPVLDMSPKQLYGKRCIQMEKICIFDESIASLQQSWGGSTGIMFYEMLEKLPSEKAIVEIDKSADEIFLLDTNQI